RPRFIVLFVSLLALSSITSLSVSAIEVQPSSGQVEGALEQGKVAAQKRSPPDTFYARFGATDELQPGGFFVTKLGGLSVMATHMALRGLHPSEADVRQVLEGQTMLVSAVIFGDVPNFAVNSYIVFDQNGRTIKPATVRFDGFANRTAVWPESPKFKAKVVASFNYADFDPNAKTMITVFPASGGEVRFAVDFSTIQ
ncbi:MAG: hypothetical protein OEV08_06785, partial [Nitrospira sp.]|nr:hypothetical protein [Nitrospira sp.]